MINTNYDFIHNTGLSKNNSLVHLIESLNVNMEEEISMIEHSRYYEDVEFARITNCPRNLSMINLNCQCLNAKFEELQVFISESCHNSGIDVITLQETWIDHETSVLPFQLEGFDLMNFPRKLSKHGGLIIHYMSKIPSLIQY